MNLELLPNEILLDLFEYINSIDLLRTFYGLNSRFNLLLYKKFRSYGFRFFGISKRNFDLICQQHLPFIADRVINLQLSNYNETPEQIPRFFSYIPSLRQFIHLRSLTLSYLQSYKTLLKVLNECQHLSYLTNLNFNSCSFLNPLNDFQLIINKIWCLPKLTKCYLGIKIKDRQKYCMPTIISSSLKDVSISNTELEWNEINRLFQYTPHLKHCSATIESSVYDSYIASPMSTLIKVNLQIYDESIVSKLHVIFQSMPNLRHLTINISRELINGDQWEQIIRNYLPKLQTLDLNMLKGFFGNEDIDIQEKVDQLMNSFRNPFWIEEHQWFVRCITINKIIHLYTGIGSHSFYSVFLDSWQSTYPDDDSQKYYNDINSIDHERIFDQPISSKICLPNIEYLHITLPINEQFWSIVPNLNRLNSLTVSSHDDIFQSQLQRLLDRAPHLRTLHISQDASLPLQMSLFKYTTASVRTLDLRPCDHYFNEEECLLFSHSPLAIQCEVLSIQVQNREGIIHLVRNMLNLRSLRIYWNNENNSNSFKSNKNDNIRIQSVYEVIQWLKDHLPSTCLVVRDSRFHHYILIWI